MRQTPYSFFGICLLLLFALGSCEEDPCEEAICAPCPSSRFVVQYQDSTGACPAAFDGDAIVYAIRQSTQDTAYTYNFSDSCEVGFLVQEDLVYNVVAPNYGFSDMVQITDFTYQDPINVTECCLCYPIASVSVMFGVDTATVSFPAGEYENVPFVRNLN
ncbi:MAG: hypothetical protein AAGN35_23925 [Bacteroidota bacterium]